MTYQNGHPRNPIKTESELCLYSYWSAKCPQTTLLIALGDPNRQNLLRGARCAHPIKQDGNIIHLFPDLKEKKGVHRC